MLTDRVSQTLKGADLHDVEKLRFIEDWRLHELPGIGPASVARIRQHFGPSIFCVSPRRAAEFLNAPYEEIETIRTNQGWSLDGNTFDKRPEAVGKQYYLSQGYSCEDGENYTIALLMAALLQRGLRKQPRCRPIHNSITGMTVVYQWIGKIDLDLERNKLIRENPTLVVDTISQSTEADLRKGLRDLWRWDKLEKQLVHDDHLVEIWRLLGPDTIHELAKHYVGKTAYIGGPI